MLSCRSLEHCSHDCLYMFSFYSLMPSTYDSTLQSTYSVVSFVAVLFLAISTIFELVCVILYAFVFPKLPIVKYFRAKAASEGSKTVSADLAAGGIQTLGVYFCLDNGARHSVIKLFWSSGDTLELFCRLNRTQKNNHAWATNSCYFRT